MADQEITENTVTTPPIQVKHTVKHPPEFKYKMHGYLKYSLLGTGSMVVFFGLFYILSQVLGARHRFDKDHATDFVNQTASVLRKSTGLVFAQKGFDSIRRKMTHTLAAGGYESVNLDRFKESTVTNDTVYKGTFDAKETAKLITQISSLRDTDILRYDNSISYIEKKIDPTLFEKYNLEQFLTTNNFWNEIEDPSKYGLTFFGLLLLVAASFTYQSYLRQHRHYAQKIKYDAAINTSGNITESWITAQTMLDSYHQRNLDQNNWTFRLSVIVMGIGFVIIFYGIHKAIGLNASVGAKGTSDAASLIAVISTASGVIINLIGGTFLAIYNSTLKQAIDYTNSLQKTSAVGTSLAILNSIEHQNGGAVDPVTAGKLIDAKVAIAKQLIGVPAV